jgi:cell division septal protein FtsQ
MKLPRTNKTSLFDNAKFNFRMFYLVIILSMILLLLSFVLYIAFYFFSIKYIRVEGEINYSSATNLIFKLKEDKSINNLFTTNIGAISTKILLDPWVKSAEIERQFPDTIIIKITEYKPKIRLNNHDIITQDNTVLHDVVFSDNRFDSFVRFYVSLPYLSYAYQYYSLAEPILKKNQMPISSLYLPEPTILIFKTANNKRIVFCGDDLLQKIKDFDMNWTKIQQQYHLASNSINYCYDHYIALEGSS